VGRPAGPQLALGLDVRRTPARFLIRDRDAKFTGLFDTVLRSEGMRVIRTPIQAPNANAHAERVIETIRAECLDWTLILGRRHLDRTLRTYAEHYNRGRPIAPATSPLPRAEARDRSPSGRATFAAGTCLGGLIHDTTGRPHESNRGSDPRRAITRFRMSGAGPVAVRRPNPPAPDGHVGRARM